MTAIASSPQDLRRDIDTRLSAGDLVGARAAAHAMWAAGPDAAAARFLSAHAEKLWPSTRTNRHRLAILRSFTAEPIAPLLEAEALLAGLGLDTWIGDFNAYPQEILNPASELYAFQPDTIILAIQSRDLTPDLWTRYGGLSPDAVEAEIDRVATQLIDLLSAIRRQTSANILCHGLERPGTPAGGLLDMTAARRQADAFEAVNGRLRAWCADTAGAYLLDYDDAIARHGRDRWFDARKFAAVKLPLTVSAMACLAAEWWRYLSVLALPPAKVLALDLDNTLWGGVVGEDGLEGLKLGPDSPGSFFCELQQAVVDIARRGVLVVLVSKNNEPDALEVIDQHPAMVLRREHLAAWRINWDAKPANLVALAAELNLGLDSFIFVDDNPAECEAVLQALPEVEVVELPKDPSLYASLLRRLPRLERLSLSQEDAERTRYYVEDRSRRDLQAQTGSLDAFLASLDIELSVEPISAATLSRAAQLTQKTNQLNTTTRRRTEAELQAQLAETGWRGYTFRARDRFGDSGVIGVAVTHDEAGASTIDTFLLSCRVIGRGVETAFLDHLAREAEAHGASVLQGAFLPTAKNAPAAQIFPQAGFTAAGDLPGGQLWRLDLKDRSLATPDWIRWTL